MFRNPWTLVIVAMVAAGCNVAKSSDQAEKEALEQRVAELEQRLAETEGETSAEVAQAPAPVAQPAAPPAPIRREPARVVAQPTPAPRVEARPEPEPVVEHAAAPAPVRVAATPAPPLVIEEGTSFDLVLENALSSRTSQAGDKVVARIEHASAPDGALVLPGGSFLEGRVVEARESGRVKGKARLDVAFDRIVVRGQRHAIETTGLSYEADNSHKRDAAIVAGGAAAGAILGKVTGGSAKKGAVLGGAAGGGTVLATKGKEVDVAAGSPASVRVLQQRVITR